ncbi:hypothetical protein CHARACLAT_017133 [Characodon lateralis]|uniref:Uncharacterized protein n=1 Tax=Characodon lateralis TaxID=208331 RepID=A0ABU7D1V2_9TELE|nr:hypothetical protein [Characodon lateralis]
MTNTIEQHPFHHARTKSTTKLNTVKEFRKHLTILVNHFIVTFYLNAVSAQAFVFTCDEGYFQCLKALKFCDTDWPYIYSFALATVHTWLFGSTAGTLNSAS